MARPKQIDDKTLLSLIEQFFIHECKGNPKMLKKPEIAQYIANQGYPGYVVTTLRRNKLACDYIDSLTKQEKDKRLITLATYKTLDVENFLATHRGKPALTKALTELDCYYRTIADSSVAAMKEYKTLKSKEESLQSSLMDAKLEIQQLSQDVYDLKLRIKELTAEKKRLGEIVEDYVYPDICCELLSQDKQLRNIDTIIDEKKLQRKIITFKSKVAVVPDKAPVPTPIPSTPKSTGSSVVQSLTDFLQEDNE